jgi:hypothetical protein
MPDGHGAGRGTLCGYTMSEFPCPYGSDGDDIFDEFGFGHGRPDASWRVLMSDCAAKKDEEVETVLIVVDRSLAGLLASKIIEDIAAVQIGAVYNHDKQVAHVFASPRIRLVVPCADASPGIHNQDDSLYFTLVRLVFEILLPSDMTKCTVLTLDSLGIAQYNPSCSEERDTIVSQGALRHIATTGPISAAEKLPCPSLKVGVRIGGLSAAVINYCEPRRIAAIVILSVRTAVFSSAAAKAYERLIPFLLTKFPISSSFRAPSNEEYLGCLRSDRFLALSANLYI